jgi:hypothetical protein
MRMQFRIYGVSISGGAKRREVTIHVIFASHILPARDDGIIRCDGVQ